MADEPVDISGMPDPGDPANPADISGMPVPPSMDAEWANAGKPQGPTDIRDATTGTLDAAEHYVRAATSWIPGGLAYAGAKLANNFVPGSTDEDAQAAKDAVEKYWTGQPFTPTGQAMVDTTNAAAAPGLARLQKGLKAFAEDSYENGIPIAPGPYDPATGRSGTINIGRHTALAGAFGATLPQALLSVVGLGAAKVGFDDVEIPPLETGAVPTAPTAPALASPPAAAVEGPITGDELLAQPDPLALHEKAAETAVTPPGTQGGPAVPAGSTAAGAAQRGGPKFTPSTSGSPYDSAPNQVDPWRQEKVVKDRQGTGAPPVPPAANGDPYNSTPAGSTRFGASQRGGPKYTPPANPVEYNAPQDENAQAGERSADQQVSRVAVLEQLNALSGDRLPEVRTSAVTGDTQQTGVDYAHAKVADPGGARMTGVIAGEQNAVRDASSNIQQSTGDPQTGIDRDALAARGTDINNLMSAVQDHFEKGTAAVYSGADQIAQGQPMSDIPRTKAILADPANFPGTDGKALHEDLIGRAQQLGFLPKSAGAAPQDALTARIQSVGLTPPPSTPAPTVQHAEQFRQFTGRVWSPSTAKTISQVRDAIDEDAAAHGGPQLYAASRAMNAQKRAMFEPDGMQKLIQPKDRAGVNGLDVADIPDHVVNQGEAQFHHIVNVVKSAAHLKSDTHDFPTLAAKAMNAIRGHMAAVLHNAGAAPIAGGWSPKPYYNKLNSMSLKLPEVFKPKELQKFQTVNRAGNILRMDRTYKGAEVEAHNIGLVGRGRQALGKGARTLLDLGAHSAGGPLGTAAVEVMGASHAVDRFIGGDQKKSWEAKRLRVVNSRITKLPEKPTPAAPEPAPRGPTPGETVQGGKQRGGPRFENNASGESSASLEAQHRDTQERAAGQHRYGIDPDGKVTPLRGVDAADMRAPQGSIIVQRGVGAQPYTVLDRGGLAPAHANGLIARAADNLRDAERLGQTRMGASQRGGPKQAPPKEEEEQLHFRHFSKLSDEKVTLDPNKMGTGIRGAERTRVAAGSPKTISAYREKYPDSAIEPELRGLNEYRISVPKSKMYDLSKDPKGFKKEAEYHGIYDHSEAEHLIKAAGYHGYYLPKGTGIFMGQGRFFKPTDATRVTKGATTHIVMRRYEPKEFAKSTAQTIGPAQDAEEALARKQWKQHWNAPELQKYGSEEAFVAARRARMKNIFQKASDYAQTLGPKSEVVDSEHSNLADAQEAAADRTEAMNGHYSFRVVPATNVKPFTRTLGDRMFGGKQRGGPKQEAPKEEESTGPVLWHGTPSDDYRGGVSGLHLGTRQAAVEALRARIGWPAEGSWDGTKPYGETLLAGKNTLEKRFGSSAMTGHNVDAPEKDYYAGEHPKGLPRYSDQTTIDPKGKPNLVRLRVTGGMTNSQAVPLSDSRANGLMKGNLSKGNAKNGFYYKNEGEDAGSVSAVVPGAAHVKREPTSADEVARDYMRSIGKEYAPAEAPQRLTVAQGKKIADAYEEMKDAPNTAPVRNSYKALVDETKAQYEAIKKSGLKIQFIKPGQTDPYAANPRLAIADVRNNNHLWVFPTEGGFGTENEAGAAHPLLADSGIKLDGRDLKNNDLFRIVHDYFGHVVEQNGFRAQGEFNAWRAHSRMYSPEAQGALAAETLGQNAWVNFGPHGEANQTASGANTVYADQKAGVMPKSIYADKNLGTDPRAHLSVEEQKQLKSASGQRMIDAFNSLPPTHELAAAALAGAAKRGWYRDSAQAITNVFGPDAPRFTALLAAMSPQTSVQMNFHNALHTFVKWDKDGRPEDPKKIRAIMEESSLKSPRNTGNSNVLHAWVPNAVRALTHPDPEKLMLSGPKVNSFMRNLQGNVNEVTLDAWMATFAHILPAKLAGGLTQSGPGKSATYLGYSAKVRQAAALLSHLTKESWTPSQVQETVWSWAKTAFEHADELKDTTIPSLVKNGAISDELIKSTPDFHQLFGNEGHASLIAGSRFAKTANGLAQRESGQGAEQGVSSQAREAAKAALHPHLMSAARRLEGVRQNRSVSEGDEEVPF